MQKVNDQVKQQKQVDEEQPSHIPSSELLKTSELNAAPSWTPGPWEYVQTGPGAKVAAGKYRIDQHWAGLASSEELRANARLIAAAPELYEACAAMIRWDAAEKKAPPYDSDNGKSFYERMNMCDEAFTKARAALAKVNAPKQEK